MGLGPREGRDRQEPGTSREMGTLSSGREPEKAAGSPPTPAGWPTKVIDPIEARKRAAKQTAGSKTRSCPELQGMRDGRTSKPRTRRLAQRKARAQWTATLRTYAYPGHWRRFRLRAIDTGLVLKALVPIWPKKPRPPGGCAAVWSPFSIGRSRAAFAMVKTPRVGAVTWKMSFQQKAKFRKSSTTRRCTMTTCQRSCRSCAQNLRSALTRSNLRS